MWRAQPDVGLPVAELRRIAERLPPRRSAIVILCENLWERTFRRVAAKYRGEVIAQRFVGAAQLAQWERQWRQTGRAV